MIRVCGQGGSKATRLLLKDQRVHWQWGETSWSYHTYVLDKMINLSALCGILPEQEGTHLQQPSSGQVYKSFYVLYGQERKQATAEGQHSRMGTKTCVQMMEW